MYKLPLSTNAFPPTEPLTVHVPVNVPGVLGEPVLIDVVNKLPIFAVPIFAFAIVALPETVKLLKTPAFADIVPVTEILFADKLPVTVTDPKVVVPPLAVEVSVNHAAALVKPSVGQTHNVWVFVLYHNCPRNGFDGGVVSAKFSNW